MMIDPITFYENNLKGKSIEEILRVIRSLKREITRLKNIVEHPNYELRAMVVHPTEKVQLFMNREYLERAKLALIEAGGIYKISIAEQNSLDFDDNIQFVSKVVFGIGGYFEGYETITFTISDNVVHKYTEHTLMLRPSNLDENIGEIDKNDFLEELKNIHIGEWRKKYDTQRFNICVMDGTQWELEIHYTNGHKPVKIYGDNAYPYNFDRLLDLFEIEKEI